MNKKNNNGLAPCSWGSAAWHFLHSISLTYPESVGFTPEDQKIKNDYYQFFNLLGYVLPCEECKGHYRTNFNSNNLMNSLSSRKDFAKWVYDLHNMVNEGTGVPKSKWPSFRDVYIKYDNLRTECGKSPGVCGSDSTGNKIMQCSVELRPKGQNIEGFSFSSITEREKNLMIVMCLLFIFIVVIFLYYSRKSTKRNYHYYGNGRRY